MLGTHPEGGTVPAPAGLPGRWQAAHPLAAGIPDWISEVVPMSNRRLRTPPVRPLKRHSRVPPRGHCLATHRGPQL